MLFGRKKYSQCPVCETPLVILELRGTEIDHCLQCKGTWLDAGELAEIAEAAGCSQVGLLRETLRGARPSQKGTKRRCPRCLARLESVRIGEGRGVEIDRCPKGHGLWFDSGEMHGMISAFSEGEEGAVSRFFADYLRHEVHNAAEGDER